MRGGGRSGDACGARAGVRRGARIAVVRRRLGVGRSVVGREWGTVAGGGRRCTGRVGGAGGAPGE